MCKKVAPAITESYQEVFRTKSGCIYQSDIEKSLLVEFANKIARFDIRCLQRLKSAVFSINLAEMATDTSRTTDVEIISLCACEHCYVLTLGEIINFRELLAGAFVMFELNSIIQERIYSIPVYA
ncbi:hypothetical protein [Xanthocytophaga agilis]|uniref:Uncharacterized protein n=1 Tax=Xanthocytophaga agilis TaxID=3048010 RepID=A0AAE3R393_9BACT|nr:hypothetical protein [Xanthocytophaga agilis]MDJ1500544.1 hypothetical protein [Xanthocytophaga agilis]